LWGCALGSIPNLANFQHSWVLNTIKARLVRRPWPKRGSRERVGDCNPYFQIKLLRVSVMKGARSSIVEHCVSRGGKLWVQFLTLPIFNMVSLRFFRRPQLKCGLTEGGGGVSGIAIYVSLF
jgi:hypothetical protein